MLILTMLIICDLIFKKNIVTLAVPFLPCICSNTNTSIKQLLSILLTYFLYNNN